MKKWEKLPNRPKGKDEFDFPDVIFKVKKRIQSDNGAKLYKDINDIIEGSYDDIYDTFEEKNSGFIVCAENVKCWKYDYFIKTKK